MSKRTSFFSLPAAAAGIFLSCVANPASAGGDIRYEYITLECMSPGLCRAQKAGPSLSGFKPEFLIFNGRPPDKDTRNPRRALPSETAALVENNSLPFYTVESGRVDTALPPPPCFNAEPPMTRMNIIVADNTDASCKLESFLGSPRIIMLFSDLNARSRETTLPRGEIIRALKIRPGMKIVDVGAGKGYFSLRMSEAVEADGKIFSTDIDPVALKHLRREIRLKKTDNILPVLVKSEGLDSFYTDHIFDIIFICEVPGLLSAQKNEEYFTDLLPSLRKDTGRLYVIEIKNIPSRTETLNKAVSSWDYGSPFFKRLRPENRNFMQKRRKGGLPEKNEREMAEDIKKMARDVSFAKEMLAYLTDGGKTPLFFFDIIHEREIMLIRYLLPRLYKDGAFKKKYAVLPLKNKQQITALNKTLMILLLRLGLNDLTSTGNSGRSSLKKISVISMLSRCGYELTKEYTFLPEHYFLEFKRKR
ncbi:MAG: methyltransferase domain-containing protein [Candidatus Omnitrophota bacterium]|jgi:ubiquinone/menaquinone biosynthesis C-methylase UbiE|nr:methyltransferase domain-containing protein [Candidatus Omnitrophota bacterium]MDD5526132.1 methyltransferase domain-containing protein [Candidatus Omnitrophota bacterium]